MNNNIFISPSNQRSNIGAYKQTNECEQCTKIAVAAGEYLTENYVCEVLLAREEDNMNTRATISELFGADVYVAIHTNAFSDKTVSGTETFYNSEDEKGKALATDLLNSVGKLTGKIRSARPNNSLIELNAPTCTRAYIEVEFHSNPEKADWIVENTDKIGQTIALSIARFMMLEKKPSDDDMPVPQESNSGLNVDKADEAKERDRAWVLKNTDFIFQTLADELDKAEAAQRYYHVEIGAFSFEANAKALNEKAREKGFNPVIKYY